MKPPDLNRARARVTASTKSSFLPDGNEATSSITSSAHRVDGAHTFPEANMSDTAFSRDILSCPREGVNSWTGMPIRLNSYISGAPDAFFSIITPSGSHS